MGKQTLLGLGTVMFFVVFFLEMRDFRLPFSKKFTFFSQIQLSFKSLFYKLVEKQDLMFSKKGRIFNQVVK